MSALAHVHGSRPGWTLFPGGVRLWHFIVLPAVGMGVAIIVFRAVDQHLIADLGSTVAGVWAIVRTLLITLLMASLIAWLALKHKGEYEAELNARSAVLVSTRDFLQSIIEGSGEAIVTLDSDGRVMSWNRAAERIYGWSASEMLGQPVERVLPDNPEVQREWNRSMEAVRAGSTVRGSAIERVRKDGKSITVRITRSPLEDSSGRFVGSTGIIRDVTALKAMESRLVERERLAAVGELAAQVAHEIKNPLAGIRGACEILSEGHARDDPKNEISHEVIRQVDRLNRTVEDLLLFAHPKAIHPLPTDVHELLDRTLGVLLEDPQTRGIEIERHYAGDMGDLRIDPQQIEQVLFNVFLNAMQVMDYNGKIVVTTYRTGAGGRIAIRDNGPGVPDELGERIFKPFFTTHAQGSGLGLAIVRNLVEAHGGTIVATSPPGGGAEFVITLPEEPRKP